MSSSNRTRVYTASVAGGSYSNTRKGDFIIETASQTAQIHVGVRNTTSNPLLTLSQNQVMFNNINDGSVRMVMNNTGIGIGKSNPTTSFDVSGVINADTLKQGNVTVSNIFYPTINTINTLALWTSNYAIIKTENGDIPNTIVSSVPIGMAPFIITSSNLVSNLNVQYLSGKDSNYYRDITNINQGVTGTGRVTLSSNPTISNLYVTRIQHIIDGTAALPTFTWSNDPDTGIYHPGSNQLAISTSGIMAMFVQSNQNIGIGTLTPGQSLDVVGNIRASSQLISTVSQGTAPLQVTSTTQVANLNASLLEGSNANQFRNVNNMTAGVLAVARGGTGASNSTGSGSVVLSDSPTITGTAIFTGLLNVTGDLTVTGTTTTVNTQNILIKDNILTINSSMSNGIPPPTLQSGIEVRRGDYSNYYFMFDEATDLFKVGVSNQLQAVATRDDNLTFGYPYFDAAQSKLITRPITTADVGGLDGVIGVNAAAAIWASNAGLFGSNTGVWASNNLRNVTNINAGTLAVAYGGTGVNTLTTNKVLVGNATNAVLQPTNLHWDNSNIRLGISNSTPAFPLDVTGDINFTGILRQGGSNISLQINATSNATFWSSNMIYSTSNSTIFSQSSYPPSTQLLETAINSGWTPQNAAGSLNYMSVCWSPERYLFVAVSSSSTLSRIMTSPDGITWTGLTSPTTAFTDICWSSELGLFVAVGNGNVGYSTNGTTWTVTALANNWYSLCWSPELNIFVAVSFDGGSNQVATSSDGISWTSQVIPNGGTAIQWQSITWSSELRLFAACAANRIMISSDGVNWTLPSVLGNSWVSIAWSSELKLFAACSISGILRILTSSDGITWTGQSCPSKQWRDISWIPELKMFVCVASDTNTANTVMTSYDGINWILRTAVSSSTAFQSTCWSKELSTLVAVGGSGGTRVMRWTTNPSVYPTASFSNILSLNRITTQGALIRPDKGAPTFEFPPTILANSNVVITNQVYGNGSYIVTTNTQKSTTNMFAWKMFSKNSNDYWGAAPADIFSSGSNFTKSSVVNGITYQGPWVAITLPERIYLDAYDIFPYQAEILPKTFYVFGKNDVDTDWTVLDAESNITTGWIAQSATRFTNTSNAVAYNNYMLLVTEINNTSNAVNWRCAEWKLYGRRTVVVDVSGIVKASSHILETNGTINTPSITWLDDPETGIYHPNSNQLAIAIGSCNMLFLNSNLRVGIGSANPQYTLDVAGNINVSGVFVNGANLNISSSVIDSAWASNTANYASNSALLKTGGTVTGQIISTVNQGTAPFSVTSTTQVPNLNASLLEGSNTSQLRNATNINSGILGVAFGGTGTASLTTNKVLVGNGTNAVLQPTNLHWDNTNSRLGVGTSNPIYPLDVSLSNELAIHPASYNTLLIWDDQTTTTKFTGVLTSSATRNTASNYIELNPAVGSTIGYLSWAMNPGNAWSLTFDYWSGGGTGADGLYINAYSTTVAANNGTGYSIFLDEYNNGGANNDAIKLYYNNSLLNTYDTGRSGYFDNQTWKRVEIQFIRRKISVTINGSEVRYFYYDPTERANMNLTNTFFYLAGFSGGITNAHRIRNIKLLKVNEFQWVSANTSNNADIVYTAGNVGIGTTAPNYPLTIVGDPLFDIGLSMVNPAMPNTWPDSKISMNLGKNQSTNNSANIIYRHIADGSTNNLVGLGLWGNDLLLNVAASGNVGIGTTNPQYRLDVNGDAKLLTKYIKSYTVSFDGTANAVRNVCRINNVDNNAANILISMVAGNTNFMGAKQYILSTKWNHTANVWMVLLPINSVANMFNGNNFELQYLSTGYDSYFRVRRTGGSTVGSISLTFTMDGINNAQTVTFTDNTGDAQTTDSTTYSIFTENINTFGGNVGIGTTTPGQALDVVGIIRASSQLISTVPFGTAPLQVSSTTQVTNLNASFLEGSNTSQLRNATNINSGILGVAFGGTGTTTNTGSGSVVLSSNPSFTGTATFATLNTTTLQQGGSNITAAQVYLASNAAFWSSNNLKNTSILQGSSILEFPPVALQGSNVTITSSTYANGYYEVTSSGEVGSNFAFNLFNKVLSDQWVANTGFVAGSNYNGSSVTMGGVTYSGPWVTITLPSGVYLDNYDITPYNVFNFPKVFYVFGKNINDLDWSLLDARTNITSGWVAGSSRKFTLTTQTISYTSFRFIVTETTATGSYGWRMSEWALNGRLDNAGVSIAGSIQASNIIIVNDGTSQMPSIFWPSDSNTGMYHPSNDTLGFATNGLERLRVTNTGVGIGITNPTNMLHLASNMPSTKAPLLMIQNTGGGGGAEATIQFETYSTNFPQAEISTTDTNFGGELIFRTKQSGTDSNLLSERVRITNAGNVGIGITNPTSTLHVVGTVNTTTLQQGGSNITAAQVYLTSNAAFWSSNNFLNTTGTGNIAYSANPTFTGTATFATLNTTTLQQGGSNITATQVYLTSNAAFTASNRAFTSLSLSGGIMTGGQIQAPATDTATVPAYTWATDSNTGLYHIGTGVIGLTTLGVNRVTVSNQFVGVGTTNPSSTLHMFSSSGLTNPIGLVLENTSENDGGINCAQYIKLKETGFGDTFGIGALFGGSGDGNRLIISSSSNNSNPNINDAKIVMLQSGRVGIGTTNPTSTLQVAGTINATTLQQGGTGVSLVGHTHSAADITSGTLAVSVGGTGAASLTANKVLVGNGTGSVVQPTNLHWDNTNNTLGIGTASPNIDSLLHLVSATNPSRLRFTTGALTTGFVIGQHPSTLSNLAFVYNEYNSDLQFGTNNLERMRITSTGSVGIGITNPGVPLDVVGSVRSTSQIISTVATGTAPLSVTSTTVVPNLNASLLEGNNGAFYRNADNINAGTVTVARGGTGANTLTANKVLVGNGTGAILQPTNLHWDNTNSRLGINQSAPLFSIDNSGDAKIGNCHIKSFNISSISATANSVRDVCSIQQGNIGLGMNITMSGIGTGFSGSKMYTLPVQYNHTANVWTVLPPISSTANFLSTNNFDLLYRVNLDTAFFRIRRTSGSTSGGGITLTFYVDSQSAAAVTFTDLTATAETTDATSYSMLTSNVAVFAGNVGIGTSTPGQPLDVVGSIRTTNQLVSTVATGTAPLSVTSTTVVPNLNASLLEGNNGAFYRNADNINAGTVTVARGGTGAASLTANKLLVGNGTGSVLQPTNLHWDNTNTQLGVGTSSTSYTLDVNGDVRLSNKYIKTYNVSFDGTANAVRNVCTINVGNNGEFIQITLTSANLNMMGSQIYIIPTKYDHTQNNWRVAAPFNTTNDFWNGNNFELHYKSWTSSVNFRIRRTSGSTSGIIIATFTVDAPTNQTLQFIDNSGTAQYTDSNSYSIFNANINTFGGNVGIGTLNPGQPLDVAGNIRTTNQLISTVATGTAPLSVTSTTVVPNLNASLLEGNNGAFYRNADNINAGTVTVARGGTGANTLTANKLLVGNGTNAVLQPTNLHWDDNNMRLGIGIVNPSSTLHVGLSNNSFAQIHLSNVDSTGRAGIQLSHRGIFSAITSFSNSALMYDTNTAAQIFYFGGTFEAMRLTSAGNIGIGSTNPGQPLDVAGNIRTTNQLISTVATGTAPLSVTSTTVVPNLNASLLEGNNGAFYRNADNINAGTVTVARGGTGANTLTANKVLVGNGTGVILQPTNLHWDNTNSRLGIGTASPSVPLQIASTISTGGMLSLSNTTNSECSMSFSSSNRSVIVGIGAFATSVATLAFSDTMFLDTNSKTVGIGNKVPQFPLHIANDSTLLTFNGTSVFAGDPTQGQLILSGSTDVNKRLALMYDTTRNIGLIQSMRYSVGATPLILQLAGGNIGVGLSNPGQPLDVVGNIRTTNQLISTVATGTAPLSVTSTTVVPNLNASLLEGNNGAFYRNADNINTGTLAVLRGGTGTTTSTGTGSVVLNSNPTFTGTATFATLNATTLQQGGSNITADQVYQTSNTAFTANSKIVNINTYNDTSVYSYPPTALGNNVTTLSNASYGNGKYTLAVDSEDLSYPAWRAFNRTSNDSWFSTFAYSSGSNYAGPPQVINGTTYPGAWISMTYTNDFCLQSYEITPHTGLYPKTFYIFGKNDTDADWTLLDSRSGITTGWANMTVRSFTVSNNTNLFNCYMLVVSEIVQTSLIAFRLAELRFNAQDFGAAVNGRLYTDSLYVETYGSMYTPSITWSNDTTTGIYHPAKGQLAFAVASNNVMFMNSNKNIGIGTSNPIYPLDVSLSNELAIHPASYNTLLLWDDQTATTRFTGVITSSATRNTASNYIELNPAVGSTIGYLSWAMNPGNAWSLTFDYWSGGGTGADGLYINAYSTSVATNTGTGYSIFLDEYNNGGANNDAIKLYYNNSLLNTYDTGRSGYFDNQTWKRVEIQFIRRKISVTINGSEVRYFYYDPTERPDMNLTNTFFYLAGFSGGITNAHRIRNIKLLKVNEFQWNAASMSNNSDIVYTAGNVGIGTTTPNYPLTIVGDPLFDIGLSMVNPSMPNTWPDSKISMNIGKNQSTNNSANIIYRHTADGSTNNLVGLGLWGNDLLLNVAASGNVGIGTTNPQYRLDVNGDAKLLTKYIKSYTVSFDGTANAVRNVCRINNVDNNAANILISMVAGNTNFMGAKQYILSTKWNHTANVWMVLLPINSVANMFNGNNFELQYLSTGYDSYFRVRRTGGSTVGSISLTFTMDGINNAQIVTFTDNTGDAQTTDSTTYSIFTENINTFGGNVGIGVTNPTSTLHVAGTINATTLQQGGTAVSLSGHSHDASAITTGTLPVARGGTGTTTSTGSGNVVLSASPTFTGTATFATLNTTTLQQGGSNITATQVYLTSNAAFTASNRAFTSLALSGGIMTGGQIQAPATDTATFPAYTWATDSNTGFYHVGTGVIGLTTLGVNRVTVSNQFVGVGTTNPSSTLHMFSSSGLTNPVGLVLENGAESDFITCAQYIKLKETGFGDTFGIGALFGGSADGNRLIISSSSNNSNPNINDAKFVLLQSGRVGIGTTNPTSTLQVAGTINATTLQQGGTGVSLVGHTHSAADITSGTLAVSVGGTGAASLTANKLLVGNGTGTVVQPTNLHWDNTNSFMGIGTSTPLSTLHVEGNTMVTSLMVNSNSPLGPITLSNGLVDGVDVSVLNNRVRVSRAAASNAVSSWIGRLSANDSTTNWQSVCWSAELGIYVAVADLGTNRVMTSTNGIAWTAYPSANDANAWQCVCWSPQLGLFAAVANGGTNRVMTSSNGTSWTGYTTPNDSTNTWSSVCWSPELSMFVAVATGGTNRVMASSNGTSWTGYSVPNISWSEVCWSSELRLFVAVGYSGTNLVMTSANGTTWTSTASANDANIWLSVCWSPELSLFAAVSSTGTPGRVMTSPNGINWTLRTSPLNDWGCVCWSPELSLFVAVAYNGSNRIMVSSNGIDWSIRTPSNDANSWSSICWSPDYSQFVAVASGGTNRVMTLRSPAIPASKSALLVNPSHMVVSGTGNVGIGTSNPTQSLDVVGSIRTTNQFISTVATGTAPLSVTSTTVVPNLNASLLEGNNGAFYRNADNINAGTVTVARGGTGTTTSTGQGSVVLNSNPTFTGTATFATLNATTLQQGGSNISLQINANSNAAFWSSNNFRNTTGTGSIVYSANPTFTGTATFATVNATTLQQGGTGVSLVGHTHSAADITSGTLAVSVGGTGAASLTANKLLVGNGTSAILQPTNLHWDNTNARLGISNATPGYALDIVGDINFTGILLKNGAAYGTSQWSNVGSSVFITNSNIGIGTTAPTEALQVNNKIYSTVQILGTSNDSVTRPSFAFKEDSNTGMYYPMLNALAFVTNGSERFRITNTNIGVFTSNPQYTFDVTGTARITNQFTVSSQFLMIPASNMTSNTLTLNGITYTTSSSGTAQGWNAFDGNSTTNWEPTNGGYGTNGAWSNTVVSNTVVSGTTYGGQWLQMQISQPTAIDTLLLYPKAGGSTFNPKDLIVAGSMDGSTWTLISSLTNISLTQNTFNSFSVNTSSIPYGYYRLIVTSNQGAGNVALAEVQFRVNTSLKLFNLSQNTSNQIYFTNVANPSGFSVGLQDTSADALLINSSLTGNLIVGTSNKERLRITNAGNVGIGTSTPGQPLDVVGAIRTTNQLISTVATGTAPLSVTSTTVVPNLNASLLEGNNGAFYRNATNINAGTLAVSVGGTGAASLTANKLLVGNGTSAVLQPTNLHWDNTNGYLGVGITAPTAPLMVSSRGGSRPDSNGLYVFNSNNSAGNHAIIAARTAGGSSGNPYVSLDVNGLAGWSLGVDNADSQKFKLQNTWDFSSTTVAVTIDRTNNRVGIKNTIPQYDLDITGTLNASSTITQGGTAVSLSGHVHDASAITSGTLAVSVGGTGATSLTANKLLVGNGTSAILQPTNLHWDNTNSRLGIGTATPGLHLDVNGYIGARATYLTNTEMGMRMLVADHDGSSDWTQYGIVQVVQSATTLTTHSNQAAISFVRTGNYTMGMGYQQGTNIFGFGQAVQSNTHFTPSFISMNPTNGNVGIGSTNPQSKLDVAGTIAASDLVITSNATGGGLAPRIVLTGDSASKPTLFFLRGPRDFRVTNDTGILRVDTIAANVVNNVAQFATNGISTLCNFTLAGNGGQMRGLSNDTATVPSYTWIGDQSTGMYHYGINQIAFSTGGSNQMIISNCNVGIGLTNPAFPCHIADDTTLLTFNGTSIYAGDTGQGQLVISGSSDTNKRLAFMYDTTRNIGLIQSMRFGAGATPLILQLAGGNIGVGTSNPGQALDVVGSIRSTSQIISTVATGTAPLSVTSTTVVPNLNASLLEGNNGAFYRNADNINAGTVTVARGGTGANTLTANKVLVGNGTGSILQPTNLHWDNTNNTLGIGTASPNIDSLLHLVSATNPSRLRFTTGALTSGFVIGQHPSTLSNLAFVYNEFNSDLQFGTNNLERMRITSTGSVGIGITNPGVPLDVAGNIRTTNQLISTVVTGTAPLSVTSTTVVPNLNASLLEGNNGAFYRNADNINAGTVTVARGGTGANTLTANKLLVGNGTGSILQPTNLHWDNTNSFMGIGTASPGAKLEIWRANAESGSNNPHLRLNQGNYKHDFFVDANVLTIRARGDVDQYGSLSFMNNNTEVMRLVGTNVGIGTNNPQAPLHVGITTGYTTTLSGYIFNSVGGTSIGTGSANQLSIRSLGLVWSESFGFYASSDKRIKKDIQDINDSSALDILRNIQPKTYRYIDAVTKGTDIVYGFIAQEVAEVLPYAVSSNTDHFIPNIYTIANITSNNMLILEKPCTSNLDRGSLSNNPIELKLYDSSNVSYSVVVEEIIDDRTIRLKENLTQDRMFVFGQKVYDFNILNKDAIFTVGVSALQEVDRQLQAALQRISTLEATVAALAQRLDNANIP